MNRILTGIAIAIIGISVIASFFFERSLWGLSSWGAVSAYAALAAALALAPQLFRKTPADPFRRIRPIQKPLVRFLVVAAVSIAAFRLLGARHDLWGERITLASALEHGRWLPAGPLATFVRWSVHRLMNGVFLWSAPETIAFFAVIAGTLFVFVAMRAAGAVFQSEEERGLRPLATAAFLANGFVRIFLGGGNAAFAALLATAFLIYAVELARGRRTLVLPALLFAAAVLSHVSAAYLLPAFLYAAWISLRAPALRKRSLAALALPAAAWLAMEIAGALRGYATPARFLRGYALSAAAGFARGGASAAAAPALDAVNAFLIIGPASIVALALLVTRRADPTRQRLPATEARAGRLLALAAIGALALVAVSARGIDGGLRWHVIASGGPALSLYALWAVRTRAAAVEGTRRAVAALFIAGVFHTIPLILMCVAPRFAEHRILTLPLDAGRAEMILAEQAEDDGDRIGAKKWYEASLAENPANPTAERRLGSMAMKEAEYPEAISHYLNAHELAPADPRYRFELAEALIGNRWFPEAIAHLETLTAAYPESVAFWRGLGFARNNGNRYGEAVAAYERALELEPRNEQNVMNLVSALFNRGAELQTEKRYDEARALYERAIGLYPTDWHAYNNLAVMEMDRGDYGKAWEILDNTLKLHPYEATLHTNMGLVLEKEGRLTEAFQHYKTSVELDPLYSKAASHLERLAKQLGLSLDDQFDSQRSPLKSP